MRAGEDNRTSTDIPTAPANELEAVRTAIFEAAGMRSNDLASDVQSLIRALRRTQSEHADLLAALKDLLEIVVNVRGTPEAGGDPCSALCDNSWCHEFGCIPMKVAAADAAIAKAEGQ